MRAGHEVAPLVVTADERLSAATNKTTMALFGPSGVGKTTLVKTLPHATTLCVDLEAGMKSVQDWPGDSIPIRCFEDAIDLACLIGGVNPAADPNGYFSTAHHQHLVAAHPELVRLLAGKSIVFLDSITDLTRQAMAWAKTRPEAFSDRTGKPDTRGAYGLMAREVIGLLNARRAPDGRTLRCADLSGRASRGEGSCVIHLEGRFAGWGFDHATGESAGPIDMVYHATGAPEPRLFDGAARLARMDRPAPPTRAAEPRQDHSHEVARILAGCVPLAGSPADRLNLADIPSRIVAPLHGDDFNDDLRRGVTAADYEQAAGAERKPPNTGTAPATVEELLTAASGLTRPPDSEPLADLLGRLVLARLDPLPERQVLAAVKTATGIAVSILEKQLGELRRRVNATGDVRRAPVRPPWASLLRMDAGGAPERNEANVITALSLDAAFAGALMFDDFSQEIIVARALPWDPAGAAHPRPWGEADDVRCAEWLQRHEINVPPVVVGRSVVAVSRNIRIHPVRDYLEALAWDGTPRLDTWAVAYFGAEDTPLHRSMAALWMVSAVARIMQPGCKADHMLILEGPQGIRKSTALKVLASEPWFTDELAELGSKDAARHIATAPAGAAGWRCHPQQHAPALAAAPEIAARVAVRHLLAARPSQAMGPPAPVECAIATVERQGRPAIGGQQHPKRADQRQVVARLASDVVAVPDPQA